MLDVSYIRENSELVKQAMVQKGEKDPEVVDRLLDVDKKWRSVVARLDQMRSESNTLSKQIGQLMGEGKKEEAL